MNVGTEGISYTLKRSARARALRLAIHADGAVVITAPYFFGIRAIEKFFADHSTWVRRKLAQVEGRTVLRIARKDIPALKRRALALAHERSAHYAKIYGVSYRKISIRAQRSRWGSCSHAGNLSFNYRIAALPAHLADYVIAHEICHLLELNHSPRFWAQVARTVPGHKALRKELRQLAFIFS